MKFIDLSGKTFNRWTVIKKGADSNTGIARYLCKCECGKEKLVRGTSLVNKTSKSCGCLMMSRVTTHGYSIGKYNKDTDKIITYTSWIVMKARCSDPAHDNYYRYGGRGITVCERWMQFENFLADMGIRPSKLHTLDRIDNQKGYYKENCRWATQLEQQNNKSSCVYIEYKGLKKTIAEWARATNLPRHKLVRSKNRLQLIEENFKC